jgi:hypothetical protein
VPTPWPSQLVGRPLVPARVVFSSVTSTEDRAGLRILDVMGMPFAGELQCDAPGRFGVLVKITRGSQVPQRRTRSARSRIASASAIGLPGLVEDCLDPGGVFPTIEVDKGDINATSRRRRVLH